MRDWINKIEILLKENNVEYEMSEIYLNHKNKPTKYMFINILNSSTMTRIKITEYVCGTIGIFVAINVQEFNEFGEQTYDKEFASIGKRFINRITRNIG